ncbi:Nn.00g066490.m01.CDS01 [Neocucurbitaria sp. VM-36]
MTDSDSSLSSPPSTDDEVPVEIAPAKSAKPPPQKKKKKSNGTILTFFKHRSPSPPPRKRPASPPHEFVPEDNPDIAFLVMFRSRFNEAFPRGAPHVGPQDIELGVAEDVPSPDVEGLLCALLGLVLNRKKPVDRVAVLERLIWYAADIGALHRKGHYGRALEEAIQTQKSQWPQEWTANPISGGRSFNTMTATERITLLHTLALWSLNQNEQIKAMINNAYKSRTTKDRLDTNIPLSVQPWGRDGDKRRYWLVEGQNDTYFRIYRESDPKLKKVQWFSVAGSIDELRVLAKKLEEEDGHKEAKALGERMINAIPRFEASENKRKRREYRLQRNAAFTRPEPGFSLYEGRTRGKRLRYTYSEEEEFDSDNFSSRRSGRQSGRETPAVPSGPTVTASGRQVRSRATGLYGEILHSGQVEDRASSDVSEEPHAGHGRSTRAGNRGNANGQLSRTLDSDGDEEDATSWDGGDEEEDEPDQMELDDDADDAGEVSSEEEEDEEQEPQTLMVTLRYGKGAVQRPSDPSPDVSAQHPATPNGVEHQPAYSMGAPLSGTGATRQPEAAPAPPAPLQAAPPQPPQQQQYVSQTHVPNGLPAQPQQPYTAPILPIAQPQPPVTELPTLDGFFPAPTPPSSAGGVALKQEQHQQQEQVQEQLQPQISYQQQPQQPPQPQPQLQHHQQQVPPQFPVSNPEPRPPQAQQQQPQQQQSSFTGIPAPTPASSWQ